MSAAAAAGPAQAVDGFLESMRCWATGVTVVTAADAHGSPQGFTASSFASLSLSPPLVGICLSVDANCHAAFNEAARFAIHVLRHDQEDMARHFARKAADKFTRWVHALGPEGVPLLDDVLARIECRTAQRQVIGDHLLVIGEVEATWVTRGEPLLYYQRSFRRIQQQAQAAKETGHHGLA
jgi:flavin reductase ActVB